jgi:hypothetical protein
MDEEADYIIKVYDSMLQYTAGLKEKTIVFKGAEKFALTKEVAIDTCRGIFETVIDSYFVDNHSNKDALWKKAIKSTFLYEAEKLLKEKLNQMERALISAKRCGYSLNYDWFKYNEIEEFGNKALKIIKEDIDAN